MSSLRVVGKNEYNEDSIIFNVLKETLYPGATDQEAYMILNYCKAKKYNPILKPVHLVEMKVKTEEIDKLVAGLHRVKKVFRR